MNTTPNIIFTEIQKLDVKKWILRPMLIAFGLLVLLMAIPMIYFYLTGGTEVMNEFFNAPFIIVTLIGGLIPCCILYIIRSRMLLEIIVTKTAFTYRYKVFSVKENSFLWNDVQLVEIKKYPYTATRPGEQNKIYTKGQDVYVMTVDMLGVEIKMKDGQYKFFTLKDPDTLLKAIRSCDSNVQLTK